jgi:RNA recognition motif-containing protein
VIVLICFLFFRTGRSRGFAFVTFESSDFVDKVLERQEKDGLNLDNKSVSEMTQP